jgi:hypothetical protein
VARHAPVFEVVSPSLHRQASVPIETGMNAGTSKLKRQDATTKGFQFPTASNNATTVHKLQGATLEKLFVSSQSHQKSWVCVVLSHATTTKGLCAWPTLNTSWQNKAKRNFVAQQLDVAWVKGRLAWLRCSGKSSH